MPSQVDHDKWKSTRNFDDPADAAVYAAVYLAGKTAGLPKGWIENNSTASSEMLAKLRYDALNSGGGSGMGDVELGGEEE
tara:strand:- start:256 stop:495 length:240 start_codon:yes stop_codon:yes gene_type:complete